MLPRELKTVRGVKVTKAKYRISLILVGNASGSEKVPAIIIGHTEKSR